MSSASEVSEKFVLKGKEAGMMTQENVIVVIMRAAMYALRISVRQNAACGPG